MNYKYEFWIEPLNIKKSPQPFIKSLENALNEVSGTIPEGIKNIVQSRAGSEWEVISHSLHL